MWGDAGQRDAGFDAMLWGGKGSSTKLCPSFITPAPTTLSLPTPVGCSFRSCLHHCSSVPLQLLLLPARCSSAFSPVARCSAFTSAASRFGSSVT